MQNYVSEDFINVPDLREKLIDRIDVLNKVKELFLIPKLEMMSARMVADFYEVSTSTLRMLYNAHKNEIDPDGTARLSSGELERKINLRSNDNLEKTTGKRGHITYTIDGVQFEIINTTSMYYSPRAVLRIGMLLRDSEVAKEVRTQLLNTFEAATPEQKTFSIDEEGKLLLDIIRAESADTAALSLKAYRDFMNRHIAEIEAQKAELKAKNDALFGENQTLQNVNDGLQTELNIVTNKIADWTPNQITRKLVMAVSPRCGGKPEFAWGKLRSNLFFHHGISLEKRRGESKKPFISFVREDEWTKVLQEAYLLAKDHGVDIQRCLGGRAAKRLANAYE